MRPRWFRAVARAALAIGLSASPAVAQTSAGPASPLSAGETVTVVGRKTTADGIEAFGSTLTRQQIDALSDDPAEMLRQLTELAGTGAVVRVDGFEGVTLPPKAHIRAIRIQRDQFAAENHAAGATVIDIITQVATGPFRFAITGLGLQSTLLTGRNPLMPEKTPTETRNYGLDLSGPLAHDRSAFSLSVNGLSAETQPNLYAASPSGDAVAVVAAVKVPTHTASVTAQFDDAITRDHTLRVAYSWTTLGSSNLGVGGFNLPDRAFAQHGDNHDVHLLEQGPMGAHVFASTRLSVSGASSSLQSATDAQTIQVIGAFTSGGAQVAGGTQALTVDLKSDVDWAHGRHSVRAGLEISRLSNRSTSRTNYLGTYTFTSLDAFNAGTPALFTQHVGTPLIRTIDDTAGLYVQDDIRVRRDVVVSAGLRYEAQNHVRDAGNLGPRAGIAWTPFASGRTTLRASGGVFYDWLPASVWDQTQMFSGQQEDVAVVDPALAPGQTPAGAEPVGVPNSYVLAPNLHLQRTRRVSAGIGQHVTSRLTVTATYSRQRATNVLSGVDLNAPVDGVRPDPARGDVIAATPEGASRGSSLVGTATFNFSPRPRDARFDWRRGSAMWYYALAKVETDALGAFVVSPTGTLATEWGPANEDVRQRLSLNVTSQAVRNLNVTVSLVAASGTPYTETTGADANGEFMFNARPAGVGRNTLHAAGQWTLNGYFGYTLPITRGRTRAVIVSVSAVNLTNHANYIGFVGLQTSPFFMQPTAVANPRAVTVNLSATF